ncbi:hypothetical protein RI129_006713 [Pyrocoelia pectoralis]|uniref:Uncharacterized protein n=1 Tax=Pyrocoelia pectoralis TaxID=417401 RepID=A0AAN7ZP55_9COLE
MVFVNNNLCCCEYFDINQQRNHLLACCCNCEDLDESVDKLLMGQTVSPNLRQNFLQTLEDRLRIPWYGGARKVRPQLLLAVIIIPGCLLIATLNIYWTCISFIFTSFLLCYIHYYCESLSGTNFFVDCTIVIQITIFIIFEFNVVPFLELLIHENHNQTLYFLSMLFAIFAFTYSANLTLTTICHPFQLYKTILLPDDCSDVYQQFEYALSFVNAIFSLYVSIVLLVKLVYEVVRVQLNKRRERYAIINVT